MCSDDTCPFPVPETLDILLNVRLLGIYRYQQLKQALDAGKSGRNVS